MRKWEIKQLLFVIFKMVSIYVEFFFYHKLKGIPRIQQVCIVKNKR